MALVGSAMFERILKANGVSDVNLAICVRSWPAELRNVPCVKVVRSRFVPQFGHKIRVCDGNVVTVLLCSDGQSVNLIPANA